MKYRILFDFGSTEGFKFEKEEYDSIDAAVKKAIDLSISYCSRFLIVNIIDWAANKGGSHDFKK